MPKGPKNIKDTRIFNSEEFFGFDTETTRCELKELRSYQAEWYDKGRIHSCVLYLVNWYADKDIERLRKVKGKLCLIKKYKNLEGLRKAVQMKHEELIFGNQPRLKKSKKGNWRNSGRKPIRCAVAFNGNFDLGAMADTCVFGENMKIGGMEGAGVHYVFNSGRHDNDKEVFGLNLKALYLGARNVPYLPKRGLLWDIQPATEQIWGASSLKAVGKHLGNHKLDFDERDPFYALKDASITREAACVLSEDILRMGFTGFPDRFISAATVSKDLMRQKYEPFFLDEEMHKWIWPAYFGGMTGATSPEVIMNRDSLSDVVYGDLDGAYSASAQNLRVFNWCGAKWISKNEVKNIIDEIKNWPESFWKYGGLHIEVEGDFDNIPIRVSNIGENSDSNPTSSQGLVWGKMRNYKTVLSIGDYLHCKPKKHKIIKGLIQTNTRNGIDLFKLCADERSKFPKKEYPIENAWWKVAGNSMYGCFAQRNGKERLQAGIWFNAILASSITGAIRHAMWIVNETAGKDSYYNDTDSALMQSRSFDKCKDALKQINIGFTNKTDDELENCLNADVAIVQGSKRYAMMKGDVFGAKCHGLGSWFVCRNGKAVSVAHDEEILKTIWQLNYPELFGNPNRNLTRLPVFHKFSIKTKRVSNLVQGYCTKKYGMKNWIQYGKAGNFGFLSPTKPVITSKKIVPEVSYEPQEASDISDILLEDVAYGWGMSMDKKYDYDNMSRWQWLGEEVRTVEAVARTQDLLYDENALLEEDISVGVKHD
tara:strand:- start:1149 stop:3443 length:2295 start_codon:yes stop_codon:yes gene_type:complete